MASKRVLILAVVILVATSTSTGWNILEVMLDEAAKRLPHVAEQLDLEIVRPADMPPRPIPEEIAPPREYEHI